jgi:thiosulfate/3-mercaptopyruvate sulfurtransferase
MTTSSGYARPDLLVEAQWVEEHRHDPNVVVVDTDVEAGYLRGHIPGAVLVPDNYEKDPETGRVHILPPDKFAALCQSLGIGDDTLVIACDNNQSLYSARLWWALSYYGHRNVKVLNGGWHSWVSQGLPISFDRPKAPAQVKFTPRVNDSVMARVDDLKANCSLDDVVVWDVRSDGEYQGTNSRGNQRAGHVPGAVHLEWFNVMERDSHRFKSAEDIRRLLLEKGVTPEKRVYTY